MNHYRVDGKKFLFVSMTKGDRCIMAEGDDDREIWNSLYYKAMGFES